MDGVVFYINVIIDYECAFDYRNMIIDLSGSSKKKKKTKQNTKKKKKNTFTNVCMGYHVSKCKKKKKKKKNTNC
jgi:hypothetical protein